MASSIPGARANLYTGLRALTGASEPLEGVGVYRTGLWRDEKVPDRIVVANAVDIERDVMALAIPTPFREDFVLNVQFEVYRKGNDIGYVEDRLWDMITAVEQYVAANKTLEGAVNKAIPGSVEEQSGPFSNDEDTLLAMGTLQIVCWAKVHLN